MEIFMDDRMAAVFLQEKLFPRKIMREYKSLDVATDYYECRPPTLPDICLQLVDSIKGASDPWEIDFIVQVKDMLKARVETWWHHVADWSSVDDAVKNLVQVTIEYTEKYLNKVEGLRSEISDLQYIFME
jgi:hypothetical protein